MPSVVEHISAGMRFEVRPDRHRKQSGNWTQFFLLAALLTLSASKTVAQVDCSQFIVKDEYSTQTDEMAYDRIRDVSCKDTKVTNQSAHSAGLSAGIPIPVLNDVFSLTFDGHTSNEASSTWAELFCKSHYELVREQLHNKALATLLDTKSADMVSACLQATYAYADISRDGSRITIHVHGAPGERLKDARILTPKSVTGCDPDNPLAWSWGERWSGEDISGRNADFGCQWDHSKTAQISLKFANADRRVVTIDSLKEQSVHMSSDYVWVTEPETYERNGLSSNGQGIGEIQTVCSSSDKAKNPDWRIPDGDSSVVYYLTGDRTCDANSLCTLVNKDSRQVCYKFGMEGHNESKPGTRPSTFHMIVLWEHRVRVSDLKPAN